MKITIVQGAFLPVPAIMGGAVEKVWEALGKEFSRSGNEVIHISRRHSKLPKTEVAKGVQHVRVRGFDAPKSLFFLKLLDLFYSMRVVKVLPAADILITNTFWMPMVARDIRFGKLYVHVARYPKGQMRLYGNAARLQTVTRSVALAIKNEVPSLASRVKVIPYPAIDAVNGLQFDIERNDRQKRILFVGRIHPEKGLHLLLRAVASIPKSLLKQWKIAIVGPTEVRFGGGGQNYLQELQEIARPFAGNVEWMGSVFDPVVLAQLYRTASVFVYPSLAEFGETFGLAPLEAMSNGCPAVVSNLECFRDYLEDGKNGFVFDHRAPEAAALLAGQIVKCMGDPIQLNQIGRNAAETAQKFSLGTIASAFMEDFHSILQGDAGVSQKL